ncbi:two-component regulator propeller domain-containing protein [Aureibaculum luteum]|uniref:two-component regulator propeller domain-containing protein n=1 Tax=Aureibaculum luteum TaxID=1548456 RepID=UPI000E4ECC57|nr:two-component regulator propeller domain-containing protein [Aureibaculum luteum]
MIRPIVIILFLFFTQELFSQEISPLKSFLPNNYLADNQNWSISQDESGIIYIANSAGLLVYNGASWKLYNTPNASAMRSVKVIDNRIYVGSYMEFGYYEKNEFGELEFTKLSDAIQNDILEDEVFWQIEHYKDWILFRTKKRIYFYNLKSKKYKFHTVNTTLNSLSVFDNQVYFHVSKEGVYTLQEGVEKLVIVDTLVKNNTVINLFNYSNALILVTNNGIFRMVKNAIEPINITLNTVFKNTTIYTAIQLNDGSIALGTVSNGLMIVDSEGNIKDHIKQENGLTNNTVLSLFQDKNNTVWLGTDYGINYVNIDASLKIFYDRKGQIGTVYDAIKHNEYIYLGSNQGLFYKRYKSADEFKIIPNTSGQVWTLFEYDGILFCGHNSGTFIIKEKKAIKIADILGSWLFREVPNHPELLFQGNYDGIHVLKRVDDNWVFQHKIKGFDFSSQFFEFSNDKIILNHEYKGVFELKFNSDFTEFTNVKKIEHFLSYQSSGLNKYKGQIYYASKEGFFKYNTETLKFNRNDSVSNYIGDDFVSGRMSITDDGIWMFGKDELINLKQGQLSNHLELRKVPFPTTLFSSMKGFQKLTKIEDNNYLIGSSNGFTLMDVNHENRKEFKIEINGIINYSRQNNFLKKLSISDNQEFKYNSNGFEISYAAIYYNAMSPVLYQTRLLGQGTHWSDWSTNYKTTYQNLPNGNYTFEVRAKVGEIQSNNVAQFMFTINKPWYQSVLAYITYLTLLLLIGYVVHINYKKYYKKQRQHLLERNKRVLALKELKAKEQFMNIEKEQLQKDIDHKNRELAISTMSIIKKNEILNSIKKELIIDNSDNTNKKVIKIIDSNINNNKDWEFLEKAFNNADKDFLKKIKNIHPNLTPNDLRFCAYLRLNLSSKEIAPLLNISVRSVEIKRYRLRKKMNLPHEKGLINYILEI